MYGVPYSYFLSVLTIRPMSTEIMLVWEWLAYKKLSQLFGKTELTFFASIKKKDS